MESDDKRAGADRWGNDSSYGWGNDSQDNNSSSGHSSHHNTTLSDYCFIATAVYGNINAEEVQVLRDIRDNVLINNKFGRKFVECYYSGSGERVARLMKDLAPSSIPLVKIGLDFIVRQYTAKKRGLSKD